jgi:DNA polymerase III gamma/tau subunit
MEQELYLKYRPSNLDEFVGNNKQIEALQSELKRGTKCFLFTGDSGCGKTTLARIVANMLETNSADIIEINTSDNRGIDTARELIQNANFAPMFSNQKVYILDECHKWTTDMQSAMLKLLEDTPKTSVFILCTTNPEKLTKALKTRLSIYNLSPLNDKELTILIKRVARAENSKITQSVIEKIIENSDGSARKALKLLNKVLGLEEANALAILNNESNENWDVELVDFCKKLITNTSLMELLKFSKSLTKFEPETIRQTVMAYCNAILLNGSIKKEVIATLQGFTQADTYRNGKSAITVALIDRNDYLKNF